MQNIIIVVDDIKNERDIIVDSLKLSFPNYEVLEFENSLELFNSVKEFQFEDVNTAIIDAVIGKMERGWDILYKLKKEWPHIKRVMISNKTTIYDMEYAINHCGLDAFIFKTENFSGENIEILGELLTKERTPLPISNIRIRNILNDLSQVKIGDSKSANLYKETVCKILTFIFYPMMVLPKFEVGTSCGNSFLDIVYINSAHSGIFLDLKNQYKSLKIIVEVKNSCELNSTYFKQIESYMGSGISQCCFLVFRGKIKKAHLKNSKYLFSKDMAVFIINDDELRQLVEEKIQFKLEKLNFFNRIDEFFHNKLSEM